MREFKDNPHWKKIHECYHGSSHWRIFRYKRSQIWVRRVPRSATHLDRWEVVYGTKL